MQRAPCNLACRSGQLAAGPAFLKRATSLQRDATSGRLIWTTFTLHALLEQAVAAAAGSRHGAPSSDVPCTSLQCDAINGKLSTEVWTIRVSFFVYVIALVTTAGWLLFMIFAGIGLVALPLDLIREFLGRPRSTISKTEYLAKAKGLGQRAKNVMVRSAWTLRIELVLLHVCVRQAAVHPVQIDDVARVKGAGQCTKSNIVPLLPY